MSLSLSSSLSIQQLGMVHPTELVLRPATVRLLAYYSYGGGGTSRTRTGGRAPRGPSPKRSHLLLGRNNDGGSFVSPSPSSSFSALATWRSHPFFAHTPMLPHRHLMFPLQELLLHPVEWDASHKSHSPRYEINDTDDKYEVVLELPVGMNASLKDNNLTIQVDESSGALSIVGKMERNDDSAGKRLRFSSSFAQTFYLDPSVDASHMTATLDDKGMLTISAPKDPSRVQSRTRTIPVTPVKAATTDLQDESDDIESTKHEGIVQDDKAA